MTIFILVNVSEKFRDEFFSTISHSRDYWEIHMLYGDWNFLVQVEIGSIEEREQVVQKVRQMSGVTEVKVLTGTK